MAGKEIEQQVEGKTSIYDYIVEPVGHERNFSIFQIFDDEKAYLLVRLMHNVNVDFEKKRKKKKNSRRFTLEN